MKRFLITILVAILVFTGSFVFFSFYLDDLEANSSDFQPQEPISFKEDVKGDDLGEGNIIEQAVEGELFFLLAGVDQLQGEGSGVRTDTLMLFKVSLDTGHIDIVSIPRDTQVVIQGEWDKINHAHSYGGMTLTLRTIRDWLGVDLDYYVKVDFDAVIEIVDAMGGVWVDVPLTIDEPSHGIYIVEGRQLLDGEEALYYARYRRGYEDGDIGRIGAQQNLMVEIIRQALSVENIPKLPSFLRTYFSKVDTNVSLGMLLNLVPLAGNMDTENISTYTIPGFEGQENGISYYFYYEEPTQEIVDDLFEEYKYKQVGEWENW